jgi:hypothetical protein
MFNEMQTNLFSLDLQCDLYLYQIDTGEGNVAIESSLRPGTAM